MKIDYINLIKQENPFTGYYNNNYSCEVDNKKVLVRIPIENSDEMDLKMIPEEKILEFLNKYDLPIPELIYLNKNPFYQVHSFIEGIVVDDMYPRNTKLPDIYIPQVIKLLENLWKIREFPLLSYFENWVKDGDTKGFYNILVNKVGDIYSKDMSEFSGLYKLLGIPSDPIKEAKELAISLKERPFVICHSDIHRKNCILDNDKVYFLDWELALFADPAYEVAVHFHKITYTEDEEIRFKKLLNNILPYDKNEFWNDVSIYLKLEKIKSAIVDAIRYYKQIHNPTTSDDTVYDLVKKYSGKLKETKNIWNNKILSPEEILKIIKKY